MMRRPSRALLLFFAVVVVSGSAPRASAEIPPPIEPAESTRLLTLDSLSTLPKPLHPKIWGLYASPGVIFDNNLNHLLINSSSNSNIRVPDAAIYTQAGATLKPDWGKTNVPTFRYDFERYDYQEHPNFSYYSNQVSGGLQTWFARHWALDTGVESNWFADETGLVTDYQSLRAGLRWRRRRWMARGGYAWRRDAFIFTPGKNAHSNIEYAEISRGFRFGQSLYSYYENRDYSASDAIFAYHSSFVEAGWSSQWTRRLRTSVSGTYLHKNYDGFDSRFGLTRQEDTYSVNLRPSFAFYPQLRLIGIYTYTQNHSNADVKSYSDQIYTLLLEARL